MLNQDFPLKVSDLPNNLATIKIAEQDTHLGMHRGKLVTLEVVVTKSIFYFQITVLVNGTLREASFTLDTIEQAVEKYNKIIKNLSSPS